MPTWALRNLLTLMWRLHIDLVYIWVVSCCWICRLPSGITLHYMQALLSFPACLPLVLLFGNVLVTHPLFNPQCLSSLLVLNVYIYSHHNSWAGLCTMHYEVFSLLHLSSLAQMNGLVHHLLECISIWGTNLTC